MRAKSFICALPIAACLMCSAFGADQVTTNPAAAGDGVQVGVAKRDGITISGAETYVTRNGATEKMTKDLILPSGVTIKPDGTIVSSTGVQATLKPTQLMTMEGVVVEIPPDPNVNPLLPPSQNSRTTTQQRSGANGSGQFSAVEGGKMQSRSQNDRNDGGSGGGSIISDGGGGFGGTAGVDGNGNGQTVFVGRDGVPFIGTVNANGTITNSSGQTVANDGSLRAINYDGRGTPTFGTVNSNGTVTRSDGSTVSPDGTVRSSDGTVINQRNGTQNTTNSGATNNANNTGSTNNTATRNNNANNAAANDANAAVLDGNGNSNPQTVQPAGTPQPVANNGVAAGTTGTTTNSPNNGGTVNVGNRSSNGNSPNNTGTVNSGAATTNNNNTGTVNNNPASASNPSGVSSAGTQTNSGNSNASNRGTTGTARGARATNGGSSSGGGGRSGASGAGGASGGSAGGASR